MKYQLHDYYLKVFLRLETWIRIRAKNHKLNLNGSQNSYDEMIRNINIVRSDLTRKGHKLTTNDILNKALENRISDSNANMKQTSSTVTSREKSTEKIIITTPSAVDNLVRITSNHSNLCDDSLRMVVENQNGNSIEYEGIEYDIRCEQCKFSSSWVSSPVLPDGQNL